MIWEEVCKRVEVPWSCEVDYDTLSYLFWSPVAMSCELSITEKVESWI